MNLQDWGAIGEVVSALAVVATLIYLAKQIRQHTHAMDGWITLRGCRGRP